MDRIIAVAVFLGVASLGAVALGAEAPVVKDPYVTTDKSIDCRTIDRILKGLIKDGMTDEEKVVTVYNWLRRVMSHGYGEQNYDLNYNFHYQVHIFGVGSCLRQTTPLSVMWERLGYKTHGWATGGHHAIQVQYGGKWHLFDPHMNFYVYDRAKPPTIASIEQIKEDLTIASDAVKEGRACPGFLLCGDTIGQFATRKNWRDMGEFPESANYRPRIVEPFGCIALRRGESYIRTWAVGDYWMLKYCAKTGPYHTCGRKDELDTVNLPILEPHVWASPSFRRYRHGAVGRLVYRPDLTTNHYADAVVQQTNLESGKSARGPANVLSLTDSTQPGEVVFSVGCPYVITAGELKVKQVGEGPVTAAVSIDRGKTWKPIVLKPQENGLSALFIAEVNGSFDGYRLRLQVPPKGGLADLELTSHFQLNARSLPYLVPGKNVVSVEAAAYGSPLTLTWDYAEGPDWKTPKSVTKTFTANGSFEIETPGPKYPRMESLVLSVAP